MAEISPEKSFWLEKSLREMNQEEWEALCDGCARCCIVKFEDVDTKEIFLTDVVCQLLDINRCRCSNYPQRSQLVPTCLVLTPELVEQLSWMPDTCAYRLLAEGKPLAWWHPLVSGSRRSVHETGISVRGKVVSEKYLSEEELEDHIIDPGE